MTGRRLSALGGRPGVVVAMVVLAGAMSMVSYLTKTPCSGPPYDAQGYSTHLVDSYRLLCLTDIQYLWVGRGVDTHQFPYVQGRLAPGVDRRASSLMARWSTRCSPVSSCG